ncbi:MAG TPA: DUF554 domain-containing protein [Firmicutes bacterium]|nr:DUF554 domain-containing protein [Bacillota bacterium]HWR56029.1 DUF554 domain-containing protein [Negativicutes bacterium]
MKGTIANTVAVALGAGLGLLLQKGIPERFKTTIMQGLSLAIFLIGVQMALKTGNVLIVIGSLVSGGLIGEALKLDHILEKLGQWFEKRLATSTGNISKGFVTSSLVYCVGSMAVVGAIQDGLTGNAEVLYAKAMLDGIASVIFSSTLGWGVMLSAVSVFIYQGAITLLANSAGAFMTSAVIAEMTATGGLLIVAIAANMLEVATIKVVNLLPAVFVSILLAFISG